MNCFQLIKSVLDEEYDRIPAKNRDKLIEERLTELSDAYSKLATKQDIDYADPVTRFAYLYRYVTSHANIVFDAIKMSSEILKLLKSSDAVQLTCIGGGPGSDFLGILKYLDQRDLTPDLKCILFDKEEAWGECWMDVDDKLESANVNISTYYQPLDVTDPRSWKKHSKYLKSQLFTMIYFASEVYSKRAEADEFFKSLFSSIEKDSLVLYVDNDDNYFTDWITKLMKNGGLEITELSHMSHQMDTNEEKTDLKEYFQKFDSPKITAKICIVIGRKK